MTLLIMTPAKSPKARGMLPLEVAAAVSVIDDAPLLIEAIVSPAGMPLPDPAAPTDRPAVFKPVIVVVPLAEPLSAAAPAMRIRALLPIRPRLEEIRS